MSNTNARAEGLKHLVLDLRQMKSFCEKPLVIEKARGIYLYDGDGRRYIDGISGIYVVNVGHGDKRILEAIRRQQERVSFVAPLHAVADISIEYGSRLAALMPGNLHTFKLVSGGSEATETALKFARQYHRQHGSPFKYKIVSNYKGFHGATMGALSATGLGGQRKTVFGPFMEGFIHMAPPTCFRCPYRLSHPGCGVLCAEMLDTVLKNEGPESVAAFIVEPIGNTGGIVTPPKEYFSILRRICSAHDVLLIFDEVITGMGRTGNWFAAQTFETTPDIMCLGKGMSGGYAPLAAAVFDDDLYFSAFWGEDSDNNFFSHGHTFGGNPISAAAGLATLEVIEKDKLIANGARIGQYIREAVDKGVKALGVLGEVRGKGCLVGVEFVQDMAGRTPFPAERRFGKCVERRLLDAGLILRCDPDWIAFGPPLTTTMAQAEEMVDVFLACVRAELENGAA
jgi:adenosylmethionine-8-amino-7-oxononanoate aminotransferase